MLAAFKNFIAENQLINDGEKILLAISGGIDSMVMASLFLHLPLSTGVAHCNFSLRGQESDLDENLVRIFSEKHKIPFFSIRFDTKSYAAKRGISIQMAARELRYDWFIQIMNKEGFDRVAVAHNLNDKAETVLINLIRGTGLKGLTGIKPASERVIRPLLFATRETIMEYALRNKVEYREDKSNSDTKYTRNKIRHKILPVLEEINPAILNTLASESDRFSELNQIVENYIEELRKNIEKQSGNKIVLNIPDLISLSKNRTALFELLRKYGLNNMQTDDLINILEGRSGSQIFTGSHRMIRNRDELIITKFKAEEFQPLIVKNPDSFPETISAVIVNINDDFTIINDPLAACLDSEKVKFPVIIRRWHAGDAFVPLGMGKTKKLSDHFIDRKYSVPEKEEKLVLESDGRIIWIIGDRIDDRYKILPETKKALILRFNPNTYNTYSL
jgi:tRNA(Ile)-lysidine synthase